MTRTEAEEEAWFVFCIARNTGASVPTAIAVAQAHLGDRYTYLLAEFWNELSNETRRN